MRWPQVTLVRKFERNWTNVPKYGSVFRVNELTRSPAAATGAEVAAAEAGPLSPGCQVVRCCQELSGGCQAAVRRCQDNSCHAVVRSVRLRGRASTSRPVRRCQACQVCQLSGAVRPVRRCQAVRPVRTRLGHNHLTTSTQIITTPLMDTPTLHPHEFFVHHLFLYINSSWRFRSAIATPPAASGGDTL